MPREPTFATYASGSNSEPRAASSRWRTRPPLLTSGATRFRPDVEALLDESSLNYIAAIGRLVVACTRPVDALMDAFRSGADALGPTPCVATPKADLESFEVLPIENDFYRFYR